MSLDLAQEFLKDEIDISQGRPSVRRRYKKSPSNFTGRADSDNRFDFKNSTGTKSDAENQSDTKFDNRETVYPTAPVIRHDNPLIRQEKNQWISGQTSYSDTYMLTKMDSIMSRLDEIQRDIDRLRAGVGNESSSINKMQNNIFEMGEKLSDQIEGMSEKNISKTTEFVRGIDASMGRLATKKSLNSTRAFHGLSLLVSLINLAGIVVIVLILLGVIR